jgi:hypothetical protein
MGCNGCVPIVTSNGCCLLERERQRADSTRFFAGEDRLARLREDALLGLTPVKHQRDDSLPLAAGLGARLSAIQSRSLRVRNSSFIAETSALPI